MADCFCNLALPHCHKTDEFTPSQSHLNVNQEKYCLRNLLIDSAYFTEDDEKLVFLGFTSDSSHLVSVQLSQDGLPLELVFWRFVRKPGPISSAKKVKTRSTDKHFFGAQIYPTVFVHLSDRPPDTDNDSEEFSMILTSSACELPELAYYEDAEGEFFCFTAHSPDVGGLFVWARTPTGLEREGICLPQLEPSLCLGLKRARQQLPLAKSRLPQVRYFVFPSPRPSNPDGFLVGIIPTSKVLNDSRNLRQSSSMIHVHIIHLTLIMATSPYLRRYALPVPLPEKSSPSCHILRHIPQTNPLKEVFTCNSCLECFQGSDSSIRQMYPSLLPSTVKVCECELASTAWPIDNNSKDVHSPIRQCCLCCERNKISVYPVEINILNAIPDLPCITSSSSNIRCRLISDPNPQQCQIQSIEPVLLSDLPRVYTCSPLPWGCVLQRDVIEKSEVVCSYFQHTRLAHYYPSWSECNVTDLVPFRHNGFEPYVSEFEGFLPGYNTKSDDLVVTEEITFSSVCNDLPKSPTKMSSLDQSFDKVICEEEENTSEEDINQSFDEDQREENGMWLCVDSDILCQQGPFHFKINPKTGAVQALSRMHFLQWKSQVLPSYTNLYKLDNLHYLEESCTEFEDPSGRIVILR